MFPKSVVVKIIKHLKLQDFSLPTYAFKIKLAVVGSGRNHQHWSTIGDPSRWRPPIFSLKTLIFLLETPLVGKPHIFVGDPHIFIGDLKIFIGEPIFSLKTPMF